MAVNWQGDNSIPPRSNNEVQAVMNELKIGRRRAYEIIRERKAKQIDTNGVGSGQRVQVMSVLISHPDAGRNSEMLMDALHREGVRIDIHDVNKTLWSLLKMGYVRLRSKDNFVYAIKVTPEGLEMYDSLSYVPVTEAPSTSVGPDQQDEARDIAVEHVQKVVEKAKAFQKEVDDLGAGKPKPPVYIDFNPEEWPQIASLRIRHLRAEKINQAAKLLEEAGVEDVALDLMERTNFNPLEQEVVLLLLILEGENIA